MVSTPGQSNAIKACHFKAQIIFNLNKFSCVKLFSKLFYERKTHKNHWFHFSVHLSFFLCKVIINGTLEEVSQENLMGYVEDFLKMELDKHGKSERISVDYLATELERHLSLRNVKCQQLQVNNQPLEPATQNTKRIAGLGDLAGVQQFLKNPGNSSQSFYNQQMTSVEVTLVEPAPVTKSQCERLIIKELGRLKKPVTHDEHTGELIIDEL